MKDLREALSAMNSSGSGTPTGPQEDDDTEKENIGGGDVQAVHFHDHGGKHSVHKISKSGKADSSDHDAGQGGSTCPLCGSKTS